MHIDKQGRTIKLNVAYLYVFAMPGNDATAVVVESLNSDGTVSGWDAIFKCQIENIDACKLYRPSTWAGKCEQHAIIERAGESALDTTP